MKGNFARNCVKKWIFFLKNNYVENSLICPKDKSENHCPTELFPIYPNNHWTIRRWDDHIVVPSSNRIKLKIDWFLDVRLLPSKSKKMSLNIARGYISRAGIINHCLAWLRPGIIRVQVLIKGGSYMRKYGKLSQIDNVFYSTWCFTDN